MTEDRPQGGDARRPTALVVSYAFPPMGGSGVQRVTKLARYLPRHGWDVDVITVKPISYYVFDAGLLDELPPRARVHRTGSLDPLRLHRLVSNLRSDSGEGPRWEVAPDASAVGWYRRLNRFLFFPDSQMLWIPFAVAGGLRQARRHRSRVVFSTAPMLSSHVAALLISRLSRLPLVVDFRDAWTQDPYLRLPSQMHRRLHLRAERAVLRSASRIVTISEPMRRNFLEAHPWLPDDRVVSIPNGFDPADFDGIQPARQVGFTVKYVGSMHPHHAAAFTAFLRGMAQARDRDRAFAREARVRLVGRVHPALHELPAELGLADAVEFQDYLPHRAAVSETLGADVLLLLVSTEPGNETSATGKLFEYLAARRPIVLIGPEGSAADIIREERAGRRFSPDQSHELADYLLDLFAHPPAELPEAPSAYSRVTHAARFADLFAECAQASGRRREHGG